MPNWCSTDYVIEGDAQEVKALYDLMKGLEEQKKLTIENGFGIAWLGCLVEALGEDWQNVRCRGHWDGLDFDGCILRFWTETAWEACNEVFDLVRKKYPSLCYYYRAEEPGMGDYYTNDIEGRYFPERYLIDLRTEKGDWQTEYFEDLASLYEWLEDIAGVPVRSEQDVLSLGERWGEIDPEAFININEFKIFEE